MKNRFLTAATSLAAWILLAGRLFAADGGELLKNGEFQHGKDAWKICDGPKGTQKTFTVAPDGPGGTPAATIAVTAAGNESGRTHVYLEQSGLALSKGVKYRLTFWVRGSGLPALRVVVKSPAGWSEIPKGSKLEVPLKPDWQRVTYEFTPTADEAGGHLYFTEINQAGAVVSLAEVSLKAAGE